MRVAQDRRGVALRHRGHDRGQQIATCRMACERGCHCRDVRDCRAINLFSGAAITVAPVVFEDGAPCRGIGGVLQVALDRRRHDVAVRQCCRAKASNHFSAHHLRNVRRIDCDDRPVPARRKRRVERCVVARLIDLAQFEHATQHIGPSLSCPRGARNGVVERGRPRQPGDQRSVRQRQVAYALVEINLRRGADTVRALPEEDSIQIERQDLLLGEFPLQPQCEEHFLQLSSQRALGGQDRIACELHRDRAAAFAHATGRHVGDHRARQALPVDARMLVEAIVLGGEERIDQHGRNLRPGERDTALLADLRNQLAVPRQNPQRHAATSLPAALQPRECPARGTETRPQSRAARAPASQRACRAVRQEFSS